jgi:nucleoside-diphosphate-sugar epimerase
MQTLFITGATGYIGGSVAVRLVAEGYGVRGLVRAERQAEELARLGITPVLGSLENAGLLQQEARLADGVINAASSDNLGAVTALIEALAGSGKLLIHTSGTSVVADDACGARAAPDTITEEMPVEPQPAKAARAAIDKLVVDAAKRGMRSVVLCNSMIYGRGRGLQPHSVQIPRLVEQARRNGVSRHIGAGLNIWSNVHIDDVVELYLLALKKARPGSFYYVASGEASLRDIAQAIADRLGLGPAQAWPVEDAIHAWGMRHALYSFASNSRVSGARAQAELGWSPRHRSLLDWIAHDSEAA